MKSAVITGANGFIGSNLIRELAARHVEIYAVIRNEKSDLSTLAGIDGVHIVQCDMNNIGELAGKIDARPEVFYHLAWNGTAGPARGDYALQFTNARWTLDAVNAAAALGCKRFVGAGTMAEFDVNAYSPLDGSTPNAVSCYGAAKIATHLMSKAECNRLGVEHLWAYLSNTYGVGNRTSNFVNFASKIMITGQPANFTSGEQLYDFVYITDIAQGLACIGESGRPNYSYYIGSGTPDKLKEFIRMIRDEIDPSITLNLGAVPFNGVCQPASTFDCTKLMKDTGYRPHVTFQDGIKTTVVWLRQQIAEEKAAAAWPADRAKGKELIRGG